MSIALIWSFVKSDLDFLEGEVASRGTVAQGHRSPQARCSSALKGLEVPSLLDRVRFTDRNERIIWFFDAWVGLPPLLAPEMVSTMMGHSWYPLLTLKF